jgi:hypothetical protein
MMEKAKYILHDTLGVLRSNIINDNPDLEAELLEAMEKYAYYKLKNHGDIADVMDDEPKCNDQDMKVKRVFYNGQWFDTKE